MSLVRSHITIVVCMVRMGWVERILNRRNKSSIRSYYSNRNQWLMLWKNMTWPNALIALPRVVVAETARFLYTVLFEPKNLRAFVDAFGLFAKMMKKRRATMRARSRVSKQVRAWFI